MAMFYNWSTEFPEKITTMLTSECEPPQHSCLDQKTPRFLPAFGLHMAAAPAEATFLSQLSAMSQTQRKDEHGLTPASLTSWASQYVLRSAFSRKHREGSLFSPCPTLLFSPLACAKLLSVPTREFFLLPLKEANQVIVLFMLPSSHIITHSYS